MSLQYTFTPTKRDHKDFYKILSQRSPFVRRTIQTLFLENSILFLLLSIGSICLLFHVDGLFWRIFFTLFPIFLLVRLPSYFRIVREKWIENVTQIELETPEISLSERTMHFTPNSLSTEMTFATEVLPWTSIRDVLVTDSAIYFFVDQFVAYFLPRRVASNTEEWEATIRTLTDYWQEAKLKPSPAPLNETEYPPPTIENFIAIQVEATKAEEAEIVKRNYPFDLPLNLTLLRLLTGLNGLLFGFILVFLWIPFGKERNWEFLFVIVPLISMFGWICLFPIYKRYQIHRTILALIDTMARERIDIQKYQVIVNPIGIWIRSKLTYAYHSWWMIKRVVDDEEGLLLCHSGTSGTFVPRRCFQSPESFNYFRDACDRYWKQAREVSEVSSTTV